MSVHSAAYKTLSVTLIVALILNLLPWRSVQAADGSSYKGLAVCWIEYPINIGGTEWHITNPNPVPLSSKPNISMRYNWRVFSDFNAVGTVLQAANGRDAGNLSPVNTVGAQSILVEWYLVTSSGVESISGNAVANANTSGKCADTVSNTSLDNTVAQAPTLATTTKAVVPTTTPIPSNDTKIVVDVHLPPSGHRTQKITGTAARTQFNAQTGPNMSILRSRVDTIGVYRPSQHAFYLQDVNQGPYGYTGIPLGTGNVYPIVGDWNGDGIDTVGVYNQDQATFSLRDSNYSGTPDYTVAFGIAGDQPLSGRWSAQATHDGIGIFRPSNGVITLRDSVSAGAADHSMVLGSPGDIGVAGDWSGKGYDSVGVYRPSVATFYLSDVNDSPTVAHTAVFGYSNMKPLVGDWTGTGHDGIGIYDPSTNVLMSLKNDPSTGYADINPFQYGVKDDIPVAGHWGNVYGVFYQGGNQNIAFTANGSSTGFKEGFPNIAFNPDQPEYPPNYPATGMPTSNTAPFTDVSVDGNGNYDGLMVAQNGSSSVSAGVGASLSAFNAVFTGYFSVTAQGIGSLNLYHDDGFILGMGRSTDSGVLPQSKASNKNIGNPVNNITPFLTLPVMSSDNENLTSRGPLTDTVQIYFPAAGIYPFEIDYFQASTSLTLNLTTSFILATPTPTATATFTASNTFTPTATATFTASNTFTPSNTATATVTPLYTASNTFTPTVTPTFSKTNTFTPSNTATNTATATFTPTVTPTFTASNTFTPSNTATFTATATLTASNTFTATVTPTFSKTNTAVFKCQNTPTPNFGSATVTPTPCYTVTPSPTLTPSITKTLTATLTPSITKTPTITLTPSITKTLTATLTPSITKTPTITLTFTASIPPTITPTPTITLTPTATKISPPGGTCIDWRDGNAHGWINSAWESGASVGWSTSGMAGTTGAVGTYYQMPTSGPYQLVFITNGTGTYSLAQGNSAPGGTPLPNAMPPNANGTFIVSQPYIELQWIASSGTPLTFLGYCFFSYSTATPTATATLPTINQPPQVNAGPSQTIALPTLTTQLNGTATDDGLPVGSTLAITWSLVAGPGTVTFDNAHITNAKATFSVQGTYTLQLSATDGQYISTNNMRVTVTNSTSTHSGGVFLTGHDPDFHAVGSNLAALGSQRIIQKAIAYVTGGISLPRILLVTDLEPPFNSGGSRQNNSVIGMSYAFDISKNFDIADYGSNNTYTYPGTSLTFVIKDLHNINFNNYDVIVVGSDAGNLSDTVPNLVFGGWLRQRELSILNARSSELRNYVNGGGGLVVFAESGGQTLASDDFGFLPFLISAANIGGSEANDKLTAFGLGIGLLDTDINQNISHNVFTNTGGMQIVDQDGLGEVVSLASRDNITVNGVVNQPPIVHVGPPQTLTWPTNSTQLVGTATDDGLPIVPNVPIGSSLTFSWAQISGSGTATFDNPTTLTPNVTFSSTGQYLLRLSASDTQYTTSADVLITVGPLATPTASPSPTPIVPPTNLNVPGCLDASINRLGPQAGLVTGLVDIKLAAGVTANSGQVDFWPTDNFALAKLLPSKTTFPTVVNSILATLDTTLLANDSYTIRFTGVDNNSQPLNCGVLITAVGNYKPGRVRFSITDLTVPVVALPITIGRTYDSLDRARVGDFGNGWSLDLGSPRLQVNPAHDVTLTQPDGRRVTFQFALQAKDWLFGSALVVPIYSPEAGVYGSLQVDCTIVIYTGGPFTCGDKPTYQPAIYTYTDPYQRVFTYSVSIDPSTQKQTSQLVSIKDLNNTLTFTRNGITSSACASICLNVQFIRDSLGRIKQIIDPLNHTYNYGYDTAGNLASVTLPDVDKPILYNYFTNADCTICDHLFKNAIDPQGNRAINTLYFPDGRLMQETDAVGNMTQYTYDVPNHTTTQTNPDNGVYVSTYDYYGDMLTQVEPSDPLSRTTTNHYDPVNHNLLSTTNGNSETTSYAYDNGRRTKVTQSINGAQVAVLTVAYNNYSGPTSLTNAAQTMWTVNYNDPNCASMPNNVTDAIGTVGAYSWDAHCSPLTQTDGNGKVTTFTYDVYGNRLSAQDPLHRTTTYTYDLMGRQTTVIDPHDAADLTNHTTLYDYDALGNIKSITNPLGGVTHYEYDSNKNKTAMIDTRNQRTTYAYDAANRLVKVVYPNLTFAVYGVETTDINGIHTITGGYDFRGNKLFEVDQSSHVTTYIYDKVGQLRSVTHGANSNDATTTTYTYDLAGRQLTVAVAGNPSTSYKYDSAGRLTDITDPMLRVTHNDYYNDGQVLDTIDGNTHTMSYVYDIRGRLTFTKYPDTTTSQQVYDGVGHIIQRIDQASKSTYYTYDDAGQLSNVCQIGSGCTDPLAQVTKYLYDYHGNLNYIEDANHNKTNFVYDVLNRQVLKTWPDATFEKFRYDGNGNQTFHQLADGKVNSLSYNSMNRPVVANYADLEQVVYGYTGTGLKNSVTDNRNTGTSYITTYQYDNLDRLKTVVQPGNAGTINYTYDGSSNRQTMSSPAGVINYTYDYDNELKTVGNSSGTLATYGYDNVGMRTQLDLSNGLSATYTYDKLNRLTDLVQYTRSAVPQTPLASYHYTLGAAGNRTNVCEQDGSTIAWTYDDVYRLLSETRTANNCIPGTGGTGSATVTPGATTAPTFAPATNTPGGPSATPNLTGTPTNGGGQNPFWSTNFTYDSVGNRLTKNESGATTYYHYNLLDQLTCSGASQALVNSGCATSQTSYVYDPRGNLTNTLDPNPMNNVTYTWDARDRMTAATLRTGQTALFTYDDGGHRTSQSISANTTNYLWDEASIYGDVIQETDGAGTQLASYILGGTELLTQTRGGNTSFYLHDGQNSVRNLANVSGIITDSYVYDAFGTTRSQAGNTTNSYLYTGQQFDLTTGDYNLRARYYYPVLGVFSSRDATHTSPDYPDKLNHYIYTSDNSINNLDPSGNDLVDFATFVKNNVEKIKPIQSLGSITLAAIDAIVTNEQLLLAAKFFQGLIAVAGFYIARGQTVAVAIAQDQDGIRQLVVSLNTNGLTQKALDAISSVTEMFGMKVNILNALPDAEDYLLEGNAHAESLMKGWAAANDMELISVAVSNVNGPCPSMCWALFEGGETPIFWSNWFVTAKDVMKK